MLWIFFNILVLCQFLRLAVLQYDPRRMDRFYETKIGVRHTCGLVSSVILMSKYSYFTTTVFANRKYRP